MLKTQQKKLLLVRNKVVLSSLRRDCAEPISASKPHDLKSKLFTSISSNEADPGRLDLSIIFSARSATQILC